MVSCSEIKPFALLKFVLQAFGLAQSKTLPDNFLPQTFSPAEFLYIFCKIPASALICVCKQVCWRICLLECRQIWTVLLILCKCFWLCAPNLEYVRKMIVSLSTVTWLHWNGIIAFQLNAWIIQCKVWTDFHGF